MGAVVAIFPFRFFTRHMSGHTANLAVCKWCTVFGNGYPDVFTIKMLGLRCVGELFDSYRFSCLSRV